MWWSKWPTTPQAECSNDAAGERDLAARPGEILCGPVAARNGGVRDAARMTHPSWQCNFRALCAARWRW